MAGGDVASLIILSRDGVDEAPSRPSPSASCRSRRPRGVAAIIADDTRIAGRVEADGIHLETGKAALAEAVDRLQAKMSVGAGGAKRATTRWNSARTRPDYIFFGRFGYDNRPEPHHRNLTLGGMVGRNDRDTLHRHGRVRRRLGRGRGRDGRRIRRTSSSAVFADGVDPGDAVAARQRHTRRTAPRFEE